jgi:hypothetical protein
MMLSCNSPQVARLASLISSRLTSAAAQASGVVPPGGCIADYEATADLVSRMKKANVLTVQAIHMNGQAMSPQLDLKDFAKAYDGPATDPKVFAAQQKKLQDELQKRAEEARKRLESQQPAAKPR